ISIIARRIRNNKSIPMKKLLIILMVAGMATSMYSCRESTQQKTEDAVKAIGEDIEDNTKKAGQKIEEGAKKVKEEINEEVNNTDDVNN
ncbi:MAG TPA: hypothetical protein VLN46_05010, partial [Gillisia sp.]|nr:hypothetical protein [Gillisia sp.]